MPTITPATVRGIVHSDIGCFRDLYDAYYSYLCGMAVSYVHNFEAAREIVDDVFIRVWERRSRLKYPPLPYLFSAVRNVCYNYLRDTKKASGVTLVLMEQLPDCCPYDESEVEDIVRLINEISDSLPQACKEVFTLHYNDGMDTAEIAERLGIAPSTVRVQIKLALDRIREKMKNNA